VVLGLVQAALGGIRYTFRGTAPTAGRTRADNTTELYLDLRGTSKYLVPGVALWLDVDRVRGSYIEGASRCRCSPTRWPRRSSA